MSAWSETREGGVVTLVHANPPRQTLTAAGVRELSQRLDALEQDASLRVLVLTGGGEGVFIAHYEVGELAAAAEGSSPAEARAPRRLHPFHELCLRLERLPIDSGLAVGQRIVTSGDGGQILPGIPIGTIVEVGPGGILVKPLADVETVSHVQVINADVDDSLVTGDIKP